MSGVYIKTYDQPEINIKEILRYSGTKKATDDIAALVDDCVSEVENQLTYKVCYSEVDLSIKDNIIDFGFAKVQSENLAKNLTSCTKAVIFCSSIGIAIDRLIAKYSRTSPAKSVILQAIGAERIEALCDRFNDDIKSSYQKLSLYTRPRFSPGYGDLPLEFQKEVFRLLDCSRKIGVTLNESMLISPSKSVTAIIGLSAKECLPQKNKCASCQKSDCTFRQHPDKE